MRTLPFSLFTLLFLITGTAFATAQDQTIYDDTLINGWRNGSAGATASLSNASPVHGGIDSISVADPSGFKGTYIYHATAFNPSAYESLSFWVYPTVAGTDVLIVYGYLNWTAQTPVKFSFTAGQINQWQHITVSLASLGVANNATFNAFLFANNTSSARTFYLDDISLVSIATPALVAVSVDAQSVVRMIDNRSYGINIEFGSRLSPGSEIDASTGPLLAAMGTHAMRFPGGSVGDDYNWQTSLGISTAEPWIGNAATFGALAEAQGAQAYVGPNYGNGTPEQAAAWVAYYNGNTTNIMALGTDSKGRDWHTVGYWASLRAAAPLATDDGNNFLRASHPVPFGFKYWEIGNECYGSWENDQHGVSGSGLSGVAHDPYTYAQAFALFYAKMLAVDPTIRIGAVAIPGEDVYGIGTHAVANPNEANSLHTGWTPVMLATLAGLGVTPHFLIHHSYPQNPPYESDPWLLQSGAPTLATDAASLRKIINDYIGSSAGAGIEFAITEMNSISGSPGKQSASLVNGLYYADAHGNLAQTEFNACTWFCFKDWNFSGMIRITRYNPQHPVIGASHDPV